MSSRVFKVLVVEDEIEIFEHIESVIREKCDRVEIHHVISKSEAVDVLKDTDSFFDYITLDLKIPTTNSATDKNPEHGLAVLGEILNSSPGTPVLMLTGTSTVEMIQGFLSQVRQEDIWGTGRERGNLQHLTKSNLVELGEIISQVYAEFSTLFDIELSTAGLDIPIQHDRILRIFVNKHNGCLGVVRRFSGGLSGASVYGLTIKNVDGNVIHNAVSKCGPRYDIQEDVSNYRNFINRLAPEATPRFIGDQHFGSASTSGVLYGWAQSFKEPFYSVVFRKQVSELLKQSIRDLLKQWHQNSTQERVAISEIRRYLVTDATAESLFSKYEIENARDFENEIVLYRQSCIHGDFHGENILVDDENEVATLIDYGDVKVGPTLLDPISLECSFLFHPSSVEKLDWPSLDPAENWAELDKYILDSNVSQAIAFCRDWSNSLKIGNREVAACLYSYALRQLKYDDTNKKVALSLITAAFKIFEES